MLLRQLRREKFRKGLLAWDGDFMGVHLYTNGAWTDSGKIYRNSVNLFSSFWESGSINSMTGENESSGTTIRTVDYIPIDYDSIYSMARNIYTGYITVRFYDENKSYVGAGSISTIDLIIGTRPSNPMIEGISFCSFRTIDTSIKYFRLCDTSNDTNTQYMLVKGNYTSETMQSYEPYNVIDWYTNTGHGYSSGAWS